MNAEFSTGINLLRLLGFRFEDRSGQPSPGVWLPLESARYLSSLAWIRAQQNLATIGSAATGKVTASSVWELTRSTLDTRVRHTPLLTTFRPALPAIKSDLWTAATREQ